MTLQIFNTLSRKKEEFIPIKKSEVTLYTCGPTVYNYVHIGNLRAMISYDILKRYLKFKGFKVKHVMNITDVDDKTIKNSKAENKSLKEFTEFYTEKFLEDIKKLNIQLPDIMPKATEEIDGMVELIQILLNKEIAYKSENGDIYFSIDKFKDYGKLAKLDKQQLKVGASGRVASDEYDKENAHDFALWKAHTEEDADVFWNTKIGKGRPGWHIECSVMSSKYLGQPFDIHMGGIDLIFPHHTNEIAQSEAAYDKKFCNYWVHNAHLIVNGEKMSKSLGNFFTLKDLLDKGHDQMAIRFELLSTHYRQRLDFREKDMEEVKNTLSKFKELLIKLNNTTSNEDNKNIESLIQKVLTNFEKNMDDDLNIGGALSEVFVFIREINKIVDNISKKDAKKIIKTLEKLDSVLGIMDFTKEKIPKEIEELAELRLKARKEKNWAQSDKLRDKIKEKGFTVDDTSDGYILKKI